MLDGLRVGDWSSRKRRLEFAFHFAEVSEITLHTKFFRLCSPPENYMHSLRHFSLNRGGELARCFNADKEISAPSPRLLNKRGLIDDIRALNHCLTRSRGCLRPGNVRRNLNDVEPTSFQLIQILLLMLKPQLPKQLRPRISKNLLADLTFLLFAFEGCDVFTGEEICYVSSEEHECLGSHVSSEEHECLGSHVFGLCSDSTELQFDLFLGLLKQLSAQLVGHSR